MSFGHRSYDGQPEPRSPLVDAGGDEASEELVLHVLGHAAFVPDADAYMRAIAHDADVCPCAGLAVQQGVVDQVGDRPREPGGVAAHLSVSQNLEFDVTTASRDLLAPSRQVVQARH